MRAFGVTLLFAATALRGVVRFWDNPGRVGLLALLAIYGVLLASPLLKVGTRQRALLGAACLLVQTACIMGSFTMGTGADFFAVLFVPLSLQAVLLFGGRAGAIWIAFFCACILVGLRGVEPQALFGLGMTIVYGGVCFLFGGYAYQVQKAESARHENERLLLDLRTAHAELQRYAHQLDDLAAEHERSRLARQLHDSVTQTAFSMNLAAESARLLLSIDPQTVGLQLEKIEQLATSAIGEIQGLSTELGAVNAIPADLPAALGNLAVERQRRDGLHITLQIIGTEAVPASVARNLYAIAQEALTNAAKHSGASQASVRLTLRSGRSSLEVEDHGKGFEPANQARGRGHLGLEEMQERAREIGWDLRVESQPGAGTRIRVLQCDEGRQT